MIERAAHFLILHGLLVLLRLTRASSPYTLHGLTLHLTRAFLILPGLLVSSSVGLARTIYIRCIYGNLGREITKYTVIYGVYVRSWPTLLFLHGVTFDRHMID